MARGIEQANPNRSQVGRSIVVERVSKGPLATVYRGIQDNLPVAIKVYRADRVVDAQTMSRVEREKEMQTRVQHETIARLVEWGTLPSGEFFLTSSWVEGDALETCLVRGPMPWSEFHPIMRALARGLRAIHSSAIVHRDLKPSNIILPREKMPPAVIIDFGHALLVDAERLTDQGFAQGSAHYMSPEQADGATPDSRSDLYALGVILYRALTGSLPFDDRTPAQVLLRHQRDPVEPPSSRLPHRSIPVAAEDLCMWLLAKEPAQRVPNANVLLAALDAVRDRTRPTSALESV